MSIDVRNAIRNMSETLSEYSDEDRNDFQDVEDDLQSSDEEEEKE